MNRTFARLFDADVSVAAADPRGEWARVLPGEESSLARATPSRRREFCAGRTLARQAMGGLGLPPQPIPAGPDRAPAWPDGVTGTISHCVDLCAAALARTDGGILTLGLDIEPAESLAVDLFEEICTPRELAWLAIRADRAGLLARAIFSAKECAYKGQYPLSRTVLGFHAMSIELDLIAERFRARFEEEVGPFDIGDEMNGRIIISSGHIVTGLVLREQDLRARWNL